MRKRLIPVAIVIEVTFCAMAAAQTDPAGAAVRPAAAELVAAGARLEKLPGSYTFTEGPCADAAGNVYFTDQPSNRILKWSLDGTVATFLSPAGRSNGLNMTPDGRLIACADEKTELWSVDADGKITVLAAGFAGKHLNGPNDVYARKNGGLYLTDPFYKRDWWNYGRAPQNLQAVYYLPPGGSELVRVADDLKQPNGITGSPDDAYLFVADIGDNKTWRYSIQVDGRLSEKTLFCTQGSDGMTIDSEGNLYLTGQGVSVFAPDGRKIAAIAVSEAWTANVCFGGVDRRTLFITASKNVYRLKMNVAGAHIPGK